MTMKALNEALTSARSVARREASNYDCIMSRGIQIYLIVNDNRQDEPVMDCSSLTKSKCKEILEKFNEAKETSDNVEIWATGGFNGSDTVRGLIDGDYDPWVSTWDVQLKPYKDILCEVEPKDSPL